MDNIESTDHADFCIKIDYVKDTENPSRVFWAMSKLIDTMQQIDNDLVWALDSDIKPILLLEDIQGNSIKAFLKNKITPMVRSIDDDAIKELEWKKIVGAYLLKAKYYIIKFLEGQTQITDSQALITLQGQLVEAAKDTKIKELPVYRQIPPARLIAGMSNIQGAANMLNKDDSATYITQYNTVNFNVNLKIAPEDIEEIVTKEAIDNEAILILKIKKPDYLGNSMWEFIYDDRGYAAKMLDEEWLKLFQNRKIALHPGYSLRVLVKTSVKYGHDNKVIATSNSIIKVIEVIPNTEYEQTSLFE